MYLIALKKTAVTLTALMMACERNRVEIEKILLASNVDLEIENQDGKKAIDHAQSEEIKQILRG